MCQVCSSKFSMFPEKEWGLALIAILVHAQISHDPGEKLGAITYEFKLFTYFHKVGVQNLVILQYGGTGIQITSQGNTLAKNFRVNFSYSEQLHRKPN